MYYPAKLSSFAALFLFLICSSVTAQESKDGWLRVTTGEGYFIEIDRSSLQIEAEGVVEAKFRTTYDKERPAGGDLGNYKYRVDSIQFDASKRRLRIREVTLIDPNQKTVSSSLNEREQDWRAISGHTAGLLFGSAKQLAPFGRWRINSYRYVSGEPPTANDPPELRSLVGSEISLTLDSVKIGKRTCSVPKFEPRRKDGDGFFKLVFDSIEPMGLSPESIESISLSCGNGRDQFPLRTAFLRTSDSRAMLLWDGVFLEIERPANLFRP